MASMVTTKLPGRYLCARPSSYQKLLSTRSHVFCTPPRKNASELFRPQVRASLAPPQDLRRSSKVLIDTEYAELNLTGVFQEAGPVRIRQHANPFKLSLMTPATVLNWEGVFPDPSLPIMVDIGCGPGRFLMMLAKQNYGSCNFLGLEIRDKLVFRAKEWAGNRSLNNVHFMVANATISFNSIISNYPGKLACVSILCPDPHFKKRHHKRRIVQEPLVDAIVRHLAPGGKVFLQSDVREVAVDMRQQFDALIGSTLTPESEFCPTKHDEEGWLLENPLGFMTEREIHALSTGSRIFRVLYSRL